MRVYVIGAVCGRDSPHAYGAQGVYVTHAPRHTSNAMQLAAAQRGLRALQAAGPANASDASDGVRELHTTSAYVHRLLTRWRPVWEQSGYRAKTGGPLRDADELRELCRTAEGVRVVLASDAADDADDCEGLAAARALLAEGSREGARAVRSGMRRLKARSVFPPAEETTGPRGSAVQTVTA